MQQETSLLGSFLWKMGHNGEEKLDLQGFKRGKNGFVRQALSALPSLPGQGR
jgi:hypothetical protein